jgi:hypothetical protein
MPMDIAQDDQLILRAGQKALTKEVSKGKG